MHHLSSAESELEKSGGGYGGAHSHHVSVGGVVLGSGGTRGYGPPSRYINLEPSFATA